MNKFFNHSLYFSFFCTLKVCTILPVRKMKFYECNVTKWLNKLYYCLSIVFSAVVLFFYFADGKVFPYP